jgi:hypothetical protein
MSKSFYFYIFKEHGKKFDPVLCCFPLFACLVGLQLHSVDGKVRFFIGKPKTGVNPVRLNG